MPDSLPPGYTLIETLGAGAFGVVHKARWKGAFECAVKIVDGSAAHRPYLGHVLEKLQSLPTREGLLRVYAFDLAGAVPHLSMALLPADAVTVDQIAGRVTEEEAWLLLKQLAESLAWLHSHDIAHAGLSGGNVFVMAGAGDGDVVTLLADIGQAWLGEGGMERLHDQAGYIPPERWRDPGRVLHGGHAETWDVYAFGVLAFRLLTGRWPLADDLFQKVLASKGTELSIDPAGFARWLEDEPAPVWPTQAASPEEEARRRLIDRCLSIDPSRRPRDMEEVLRELKTTLPARPAATADKAEVATASAGVLSKGESLVPRPLAPEILPEVPAFEKDSAAAAADDAESAGTSADPKPAEETNPAGSPDSPPAAPAAGKKSGETKRRIVWWPAAVGFAAAAAAVAVSLRTQGVARSADMARAAAVREMTALQGKEAAIATKTAELSAALEAEKPRGIAALRDQAAEVADQMLATRPLDTDVRQAAAAALRDASATAVKPADKNTTTSILIAADSASDAAQSVWTAAATPAAEALANALAAADALPTLTAGGLNARRVLADLRISMNQNTEALAVLEHLSRDIKTADAAQAPDEGGSRKLLAARTAAARGRILLAARKSMDADPLLREASALFEDWLAGHPDDRGAARDYAANSLQEGLALLDRRQTEDARTAFLRVAGLAGRPGDADFQPADSLVLARALLESGRLDAAGKKIEPAIEQHMQAVRLLVDYDKAHPNSVACRSLLAEGYTGLGRLLTLNGTPGDASVAFAEAVTLLSDLTRERGDTTAYKLQLALTYDDVARLIRASRPGPDGVKEAIVYQNGSVTTLRNLNETNALDNVYRRSLAASLELNGELLEASGEPAAARARLEEALEITTALAEEETLPENERLECRRLGARALTVLGGIHEKAGRKKDAIAALTRAVSEWEASSPAATAADEPLVASAKEKLKKLQPEG